MKKYISFLFSALLLASSCVDSRYDGMVADTAYFPKSDLQEQIVTVMNADDYIYDIWIHKGGYFQNKFAGSLALDYSYLVAFNNSHSTDYKMLDEKYYSFERTFVIEAGSNEVSVPLTLKTGSIVGDFGYGTYYIPLSVHSTTPGEEIYVDKENLLLAITFQQPILGIDGDNKGEVLLDLSTETVETYDLDVTAILDVKAPEDLLITYAEDRSLLIGEEKALDPQYYSYRAEILMASGEQYAENYLTLNVANMPKGRWVVPVRMSTSNDKVKMADDAYVKLTVVKGTLDDIQWAGDYLQTNEIIVSASTLEKTLIATTNGADTEVSVDESWINVNKEGDNVYMSITEENTSTNQERLATVKITDKATLLDKTILVRQCMQGYGLLLNKKLWSIPEYSPNTANKTGEFGKLYDNSWPIVQPNPNDTHIEFNGSSDPYILTFDLGISPHGYNSLGLMPRLQWTRPAPKKVKIEVSSDRSSWTTITSPISGDIWDAFTEDELKGSTNSFDNHYEGMVHWFDFTNIHNYRYMRLSFYDSFVNSGSNHVICFNEVFISQR